MSYRAVSRLLGILLLTAAILKLFGLSFGLVAQTGWLSSPRVQALVIQSELILGVWLLWGIYPVGAWLAATATFAGFAVASFDAGWAGMNSCGCFGPLKVSPWVAFAVDVLALVGLVMLRPNLRLAWRAARDPLARHRLAETIATCMAVVSALVVLGAVAWIGFGSPREAVVRLRGESVTVEPSVVDAGSGPPGQIVATSVEVKNWTDRPLRVVGGTINCAFSAVDDLPVVVPPRETRTVTVRLMLPPVPGRTVERMATLFVGDEQFQAVHFRLTGQSQEEAEKQDSLGER